MKSSNNAALRKSPICPYCNAQSEVRTLAEITGKKIPGKAYVCHNFPECDSYVKINVQTGLPLGTMADKHLRDLRAEAHRQISRLYADGSDTRENIYAWMARELGLSRRETHIGLFREYYCQQVIQMAKEEYDRRRAKRETAAGRRVPATMSQRDN